MNEDACWVWNKSNMMRKTIVNVISTQFLAMESRYIENDAKQPGGQNQHKTFSSVIASFSE